MSSLKKINHPIISSYIGDFISRYEIPPNDAVDEHSVFEMFLNELVLESYTNDGSASYEEMKTGRAIGIDGIAIFVADKIITSVADFDLVTADMKRFDVDFYFTQAKTSENFDRQSINDFMNAVIKFFDLGREKCLIPELSGFWEIAKRIYEHVSKFKKGLPSIHLVYACLASSEPDFKGDVHLAADVELNKANILKLNMLNEDDAFFDFIGIKQIMGMVKKISSQREITISMSKTPISYPKDAKNKIKNAYFGLLRIDQLVKMISEDVVSASGGVKRVLKKGVFDDNIRFYLGVSEKVHVNMSIKEQLIGEGYHLFGLLNNGITVICDEVRLNSEELTLVNYQIVNGCQTSNVIFEIMSENELEGRQEVSIPVRLIATDDEETKSSIIKGTNSQTSLTPAQLMALSAIQKAIEEFYSAKRKSNAFDLFYERRTEQFRGEEIPKTKIINIPTQIKCISALFFNLPHEVSGQYGKVEKTTRGWLFDNENDMNFLNVYYVSGLCWYKVERFVLSNEEGKKIKRARWHIMMLLKLLNCKKSDLDALISSRQNKIDGRMKLASEVLEGLMLGGDDVLHDSILRAIRFIKKSLSEYYNISEDEILSDRKVFERKETTTALISAVKTFREKN